jgi:hypothetical protein
VATKRLRTALSHAYNKSSSLQAKVKHTHHPAPFACQAAQTASPMHNKRRTRLPFSCSTFCETCFASPRYQLHLMTQHTGQGTGLFRFQTSCISFKIILVRRSQSYTILAALSFCFLMLAGALLTKLPRASCVQVCRVEGLRSNAVMSLHLLNGRRDTWASKQREGETVQTKRRRRRSKSRWHTGRKGKCREQSRK